MGSQTFFPLHQPYSGPNDNDPLTDDELALLLAIPRAAESTPEATLFRFPLGHDPSMGWIDATCAEVRSIVARLAEVWRLRLFNSLGEPSNIVSACSVGPGTTICVSIKPDFHGIFHLLAFWALGCTVRFGSMELPSAVIEQLNESGCKVLLCSGFDDRWIEARRKEFNGVVIPLPEEEQAHQLAKAEKQRLAGTPPPWPIPRRPSPALILQTSGTTGKAKILRMSLHFYTIGHAYNCRSYLESACPSRTSKTPYSHPRLIPIPFFWASGYRYLFVHLTTATPLAFANFTSILHFSPNQLVSWAKGLDVGAIACTAGLARLIPRATLETHAGFLQSLSSFTFSGSPIDNKLSSLYESLKLPITNLYGMAELSRILYASRAPYTHLRPFPDMPPPLVRPISEPDSDGSRHVELWFTPAMSRHLAHHFVHGGVPIELEPFPGDGPHKGELAFNLGDIFQEITSSNGAESETAYIHVGRHSDQVRLGGGGAGIIDAALYEATLESCINARIGQSGACPWALDGVQLFGNNMACTALVLQLRPDEGIATSRGTDIWKSIPVDELHQSVEDTNDSMGLTGCRRVHATQRTLIISSDGQYVHGSGGERLAGYCVSLSMTHKRTVKRWENVCKLKPWLDGLDFNEPNLTEYLC